MPRPKKINHIITLTFTETVEAGDKLIKPKSIVTAVRTALLSHVGGDATASFIEGDDVRFKSIKLAEV